MNSLSVVLFVVFLPFSVISQLKMQGSIPLVKKPGETLSLSCRGSGFTFGSYGMNWVKQPAGKPLEWMGYIYTHGRNTDYSSSFQDRIEITRDNSNSMVSLRLSNLSPEDSAVYYCARRAQLYSLFNLDVWGKGTTVTVNS
uniref:Immunoglobulin heavy variable 4-9 n=1 Tax=Poecilia formosa TaxID=48698 RepID=A0A087XVA4_POEFO